VAIGTRSAAFVFQHAWTTGKENAVGSFPINLQIYVLLPVRLALLDWTVNEEIQSVLTWRRFFENLVAEVPEEWLLAGRDSDDNKELRPRPYSQVFWHSPFLFRSNHQKEAQDARTTLRMSNSPSIRVVLGRARNVHQCWAVIFRWFPNRFLDAKSVWMRQNY